LKPKKKSTKRRLRVLAAIRTHGELRSFQPIADVEPQDERRADRHSQSESAGASTPRFVVVFDHARP